MALATLAQLKEYLGVTETTDDALLSRLLDVCSASIEKWCSVRFKAADYTGAFDGNGRAAIFISQEPLISVSAVAIAGVPVQASASITQAGFYVADRALRLRGGLVFPLGEKNVEAEFRAGYETIPADVVQACVKLAALRYKERDRLGTASRSIGGESMSVTNDDFPESVERVLNDYKSVVSL